MNQNEEIALAWASEAPMEHVCRGIRIANGGLLSRVAIIAVENHREGRKPALASVIRDAIVRAHRVATKASS